MKELLRGDHCSEYTARSHIFKAIKITASYGRSRLKIVKKIIKEALGNDMPEGETSIYIISNRGVNKLEKEMGELLRN